MRVHSRRHRRPAAPEGARPIALCCVAAALVLLVGLLSACAIPGQLYPVSPSVSGELDHRDRSPQGAELKLTVANRDSSDLFKNTIFALEPSAQAARETFFFDAVWLAVAGHEYSKLYRAYLHLRSGTEQRVIWRAEFSRLHLGPPIELACDLDRPIALGQVCRVKNPLQHAWLIRSGQRSFERLCASCHGKGPQSKAGEAPAPDLSLIASRYGGIFDRDLVAQWIEGRTLTEAHGPRTMPVWGERLSQRFQRHTEGDELIGATLDPLLAYLESIQQQGEE